MSTSKNSLGVPQKITELQYDSITIAYIQNYSIIQILVLQRTENTCLQGEQVDEFMADLLVIFKWKQP